MKKMFFLAVGLTLFAATAFGQTTFSLVIDSVVRIGQDTALSYYHGYSKNSIKLFAICRGVSNPSFSFTSDTLTTKGTLSGYFKLSNMGADSSYKATVTGIDIVTGVRKSDKDSILFKTALPLKEPEIKIVTIDSVDQKQFRVSFGYDFGGSPTYAFVEYGKTTSFGYRTDSLFNLTGIGSGKLLIKNCEPNMNYYVRVCSKNKEKLEDCSSPIKVTTAPPQKALITSVSNQFIDTDTVSIKVVSNLRGATNPRALVVLMAGNSKKFSDTIAISPEGLAVLGVGNLPTATMCTYKVYLFSNEGRDSVVNKSVKTANMPSLPTVLLLTPSSNDSSCTLSARIYCNNGQTFYEFLWRKKGTTDFIYSGERYLGNSGGFDVSYLAEMLDHDTDYEYKVLARNAAGMKESSLGEFKTLKKVSASLGNLQILDFAVYPNPAKDVVSVTLTEGIEKAEIFFYDMTGKMLKAVTIGYAEQISIDELPSGLYMYRVQTSTGVCGGKLVVE